MKKINYTGSSKLISRIVDLINRKVPMPTDSQDNIDWGTSGQVLITDGAGGTTWGNQISGIDFEVVSVLPTTDISQSTIYLVPKSTAGTNNVYDEYINTTGTSAGWELIGDTTIDLSNYYTKTESDNLLNNKVDKVTGKQLTTEDFTTALKGKLEGIASGAEVNVQSDWTQSDNTKDDFIKNKPTITDENVKQTATTGNYDFRVLLSATATDGDYTGVVKKNTNLKYNASTGNLQVPKINGVDVGNAPEFTDLKVLYGTCSTAASDPDKKVVLSGTTLTDAQYSSLPIGTFLAVKYDNTNSASNCTVSIVDTATNPTKYTTPASIYYSASAYTGSSNLVCGYAGRHVFYVWNGTYWVWNNRGVETSFSSMSANELVTGTATDQRAVRADYLNSGIRELINSYGWGTQAAIQITGTSSSHKDLNTYTTVGNYTCKTNDLAAYVDNKPTGSTNTAFNLIVIKNLGADGTNYFRQVAWTYKNTDFYIRYTTDGGSTWTTWRNLYQTVGTAALTLKQNGETLDSFSANATSAKTIDITTPLAGTLYGTCTTGASTAVKVITLDSSYSGTASLPVGTTVNVVFESSNTSTSPSIKIGDTTYTVKILSNTTPNVYNSGINMPYGHDVIEAGGIAGYVCRYLIADSSTAIYLGRNIAPQAEKMYYDLAQPVGNIYTENTNLSPFSGTLYRVKVGQKRTNVNTDSVFSVGFNVRLPFTTGTAYSSVIYNAQVWGTLVSNISNESAYKLEIDNIWYHPAANTEYSALWFYFKPINKGTKDLIYTGEVEFTLTAY